MGHTRAHTRTHSPANISRTHPRRQSQAIRFPAVRLRAFTNFIFPRIPLGSAAIIPSRMRKLRHREARTAEGHGASEHRAETGTPACEAIKGKLP